jgi:hypothetical protein
VDVGLWLIAMAILIRLTAGTSWRGEVTRRHVGASALSAALIALAVLVVPQSGAEESDDDPVSVLIFVVAIGVLLTIGLIVGNAASREATVRVLAPWLIGVPVVAFLLHGLLGWSWFASQLGAGAAVLAFCLVSLRPRQSTDGQSETS